MEVASEELVATSASATALAGQGQTGARPPLPLRPSLPRAPQQGPNDATRSNAMTKPRQWQTQHIPRSEVQPVEYTVPQRREEASVHQSQLVLHPMPTVRHMTTLRPSANLHLILSRLLIHNDTRMPLQAIQGGPSSIRFNMRTHLFPIQSIPFPLPHLQFLFPVGVPRGEGHHLFLPQ